MDVKDDTLLRRVFGDDYKIETMTDGSYIVKFKTPKGDGYVSGTTIDMCMRTHIDATIGAKKQCTDLDHDLKQCSKWWDSDRVCKFACDDDRLGYCLLNLFTL